MVLIRTTTNKGATGGRTLLYFFVKISYDYFLMPNVSLAPLNIVFQVR